MDDKKIGVIIPVYNRPALIIKALNSITQQTTPPDQVVIVDDGSTDSTAEAVEKWISTYKGPLNFCLETIPHGGVSKARNYGIKLLHNYEFLAMLDSDDHWPSDFLARSLLMLEHNKDLVAASTDRQFKRDSGEVKNDCLRELPQDPIGWMIKKDAGIASCTVFRSRFIIKLNGFDENLFTGEDTHLFMRLSLLGKWSYVEGAPVQFCQQTRNIEEENLSRKHSDRNYRWANIYENFLKKEVTETHPLYKDWQKKVAKRWYKAGIQCKRNGELEKANHSLNLACSKYPYSIKFWLHNIHTKLLLLKNLKS